jgi:hypothetical protein
MKQTDAEFEVMAKKETFQISNIDRVEIRRELQQYLIEVTDKHDRISWHSYEDSLQAAWAAFLEKFENENTD